MSDTLRSKDKKSRAHCPDIGIACPRCGSRFLVTVFTRYRKGAIVRVRRCKADGCGHRIRTVERVESYSS